MGFWDESFSTYSKEEKKEFILNSKAKENGLYEIDLDNYLDEYDEDYYYDDEDDD